MPRVECLKTKYIHYSEDLSNAKYLIFLIFIWQIMSDFITLSYFTYTWDYNNSVF